MSEDRSWMRSAKGSPQWLQGLREFLATTFGGTSRGGTAPCPCRRCRTMSYITQSEMQRHLVLRGFDESFIEEKASGEDPDEFDACNDGPTGDAASAREVVSSLLYGAIHGEIKDDVPNESAKKFFALLKEAEKELYPGCKEATKLSFIVRLFQIKCMFGLSNSALEAILLLFSLVLPPGHEVPNTVDKVQKVVRELGLGYEKIHACVNDCVLFRKDYAGLDECPTCGESRWKAATPAGKDEASGAAAGKKRVPQKILRYFPLIPRLKRLYMSGSTSSLMRWHKEGLVSDGKMRHPADSMAWKHVDNKYPDFASDPRNVRLGLASDGFNPFGMLNITYTTWPVILIPYNLPPWLCLKQSFWMMSMLIPGPKSPGNAIDVYMQPLIDELKELWINGVETWDAKVKKNFTLRALLLWTINDFPAYGMLSGWSTKGKFACPYCHKDTDYLWLKYGSKHCYMGNRRFLPSNHRWRRNKRSFNNSVETREAPVPLTGEQVLQQYESFEQVTFGKTTRKRKQREEETRWHNWRKKSVFFELPYWETLLVRHNLDVMHIDKNICESILGTLLELSGKSKDGEKARLDMQHMGVREDQHPVIKNGKYSLPPALYHLGKAEKTYLCKFLEGVKMPDGYASNFKRFVDVKGCKVSGLKTHDYHIIFQKLLPLAARNILPEDVAIPLIQLSRFFNSLCSKELVADELDKLSILIRETLCRLEMTFPPGFFDIMMHLPVHLAEEAKLGGPVCYRWMYPIERYLRTLKGYVRNKACPEGSIAEGYVSEECMTFCSRFLENVDTKLNRPERHESATVSEPPSGLSIFGDIDYSKKGFVIESVDRFQMQRMRHYMLTNCDEAIPFVKEHMDLLRNISPRNVEKRHKEQFVGWFERKISKLHGEGKTSDLMYALSQGPDHRVRVFNRCFINGFLFRTADIEKNLTTQNSGVVVRGDDSTGNIDCKDQYGIIDIDPTRLRYLNDPYILGTQAEQVFYVKGAKKSDWFTVVRLKPRNLFAMPAAADSENEVEIDVESLDVGVENMNVLHSEEELKNWRRPGMEGVTGDAAVIEKALAELVPEPNDSDLEDDEDDDDDTYIDDGHVAPVESESQGADEYFFV
ncbi:hypothetical protein ACP70R_025053 [Stipagrostis hirtigluma subsp. patula]